MGILQARPSVLSSVLSGRGDRKRGGGVGTVAGTVGTDGGHSSATRTPLPFFSRDARVCSQAFAAKKRRKFDNLGKTEEAARNRGWGTRWELS